MRLTAIITLCLCFLLTACVNTHPSRIKDYPVITDSANLTNSDKCEIAALEQIQYIATNKDLYKSDGNVSGYVEALEKKSDTYESVLRTAREQYLDCRQE